MIWTAFVLASVAAGWLLGRGDAAANLRAAQLSVPAALLIASFGGTLGFLGRDRLRRGSGYASPTASLAGKLVAVGALAAAAAAAFSPVDWPAGSLRDCSALFAAGYALWLANLPRRL